jgi:hypothetical protein
MAIFSELAPSGMSAAMSSRWLDFGRHGHDLELPMLSMAAILELLASPMATAQPSLVNRGR